MVEITLLLAAMVENQYITTTRVENEYYWSKIDVYYSFRSKITQAGYPAIPFVDDGAHDRIDGDNQVR
jgi:hypothetical protein